MGLSVKDYNEHIKKKKENQSSAGDAGDILSQKTIEEMLTLTETFDDNLAEDLEKSFLSSCDLMIDTAEEPNEEERKVNIAKKISRTNWRYAR